MRGAETSLRMIDATKKTVRGRAWRHCGRVTLR